MMRKFTLFRERLKVFSAIVLGTLCCSLAGYAQITGYTFSTNVGTFTPIAGGTTVGNIASSQEQYSGDPITPVFTSANLTGSFAVGATVGFPIGFVFNLGGISFDRFSISTEGYIKLGSSTDPYVSIQTPSTLTTQFGTIPEGRNIIAALGNNLMAQAGASMKYITTGSSPNRVLTVEWLGYSRNGAVGDNLNFQIKLFETTNVVNLVYGTFTSAIASSINNTAGMIGLSNTDYKKVGNTLLATTMDNPVVSPTNLTSPFTNERVQWRNGSFPTSGRTYEFTPAGITCNYPVIPQGVVSGTQVNLSWGAAAGATSYNVEYRALPSGTFAAAPGGTGMVGTSLAVTGLTPATSYEFRVQSNCNGANWITFSRTIPGPGETCALAIPYGAVAASAGACTPTLVTNGLSVDGSSTISCAGVSVLDDIWYSFVAPSNGKKLWIETTADGASNPDWAMQIYSSCGGAPIGCWDDLSGSDFRPVGEMCQFDYTGGATYYVRLMRMQFYGSGATINLCIYEDVACPVVPANNLCSAASSYTLQPYGSCPGADVNYTTENATTTTDFVLANPSCFPVGSANDVWVTFNSGANTAVNFRYTLVDATNVQAQIYSGTCGTGTMIPVGGTCFTAAGSYAITGLTASTNYYVRFWSPSSTSPTAGNFTVCIQEAADCPGGLGTLGVDYIDVGNIGASYYSGVRTTCGHGNDLIGSSMNAVCGSNNYLTGEDDVFKFQVPSTGLYQIIETSNSAWVGLKLFSNCPLLGRGGACVASAGTSTASKNLSSINLTAGVDYYLIVDQFAPPTCIGQYDITIQPNPAPPVNDNCGVNAITLTQNVTCNYNTYSYSAGATTSAEAGACAANDDDVWYKFTALTSDPLITVSPSAGYYPVVELFTACGTSSICCMFNPTGQGLPVTLNPPIALTPGNTYYLRVYHAFAGSPGTDDYDICITNGSGEASCLTIPGGATPEAEACGAFTNSSPAFEPITNGQTIHGKGYAECGFRDFDYFRITTAAPGYVTFTVNSEFPVIVRMMDEAAGAAGATITTAQSVSECAGNISVANPTIKPAGNYWVYVLPANFEDVGCASTRNDYVITATFTPTPPAPQANDNCALAETLIPCGPAANGSTLSASQSFSPNVCNADQSNYAYDLWYKFTATAALHTINTTGNFDGVMEVHQGCGLANIACADFSAGTTETLNLTTVPGNLYYIRYFAYSVSQPVPGNFTISVTTPGGWSGQTSNDWNVATNWCSGLVPGVGTNVLIPNVTPSPVLLTAGNAANVTLLPGATITTTPASLNVRGNVLGTGNTLTGTSPFILAGTSGQSVSGALTFTNVRQSNTTLGGVSVSNGADVRIAGVMTLDPNARFNNTGTGTVTVVSNATTEGSIGVVGAGAQLNGNYTIQRYIPFTGPGWHFMSTSASGTNLSQWTDDFEMKTEAPVGGTNGVIAVTPERSTIFRYSESAHNVKLDTVQKDGWRVPSTANLTPGAGYRVFMAPAYFNNNPSKIVENVGGVTLGLGAGFNFPIMTRNEYAPCFPTIPTFNPTVCNESNRGWNLLANPFPSPIDWDAASGWTKPGNMNNAFFIWNAAGGGYQVWVGSAPPGNALGQNASTNTNPNIIPKGQGFFVRLSNPGTYTNTLTATEAVKVATSGQFVRTAVDYSFLKVRISKPALPDNSFDAMVRFMNGATDAFDQHMDANLLPGVNASVGFVVGNENMIMNSLAPLTGTKTVVMKTFYGGQVGAYKLEFLNQVSFPANQHIYLKDKFLNALVDIKANPVYNFNIAFSNNSNTNDRFELVFSPTAITEVKPTLVDGTSFAIYPNPTSGKNPMAYVTGSVDEKVSISVVDMLGKEVYRSTMTILADGEGQHEINTRLSAGMYNVTCVGKSKVLTTKMIVD